ncbi:hypothetical protein PFISCL1PPCAC_23008, partial [Pristionchus fissidentatus]
RSRPLSGELEKTTMFMQIKFEDVLSECERHLIGEKIILPQPTLNETQTSSVAPAENVTSTPEPIYMMGDGDFDDTEDFKDEDDDDEEEDAHAPAGAAQHHHEEAEGHGHSHDLPSTKKSGAPNTPMLPFLIPFTIVILY